MGRKIPGKKHRGVKDPLKQQAKRLAELETKINAPPKDADEQAIPKSLERVVKLKEAVKSGKITKVKKKKKKKNALISVGGRLCSKPLHPKARPDKVVPVFQQRPGESESRFLHRVNRDTHAFINETAFEKKYSVQVNRNPDTGKIEGLSKCEKTEIDEIEMLRGKHKNIKKKKKEKDTDKPKMSKSEKRREKLKSKKQKQMEEKVDEFDSFKDQVKFGEVVHEPPQLKVRPKHADNISTFKPGKKKLLLHSILKKNEKTKMGTKKTTAIDRSGKRKNLPVGERRQLEKQQTDIIAAYRMLKAQRSAGVNN
ncbi:coiled-coil domain-containing protein 137 [Bombus pascuorum]|uniref:coiled-coil domain-containing protein 137 n=1 Tax=Bombus pascuorum TaxID=65598 RepID=UPI002133DEA9|nr:coiled-coil domain-containing protein 137 [Bombus pascuorum]XP_060827168.1 coiled-coil domain-containing protein 137 [Bombus pascuorum]